MKIDFIITGTGRCGTVYMAKVLTQMGIPCGHESIFDYAGIDKATSILDDKSLTQTSDVSQRSGHYVDVETIRAESSYLAAPFLEHKLIENIPVIHVTRHPLKVISSFINEANYFKKDKRLNEYEQFIYTHLPELKQYPTQLLKTMYYYIRWNQLIFDSCLHRPYFRIQAEEKDLTALAKFIGANLDCPEAYNVSRNTNSWRNGKDHTLDWSDLPPNHPLTVMLFNTALRYGYDAPLVYKTML